MRKMLLAAVLACVPLLAEAQQYDSGWQIVDAKDISDVEYSGAGVRVNNLLLTQSEAPKGNQLATYAFSATVVKRVPGRRSVRVELVGMRADGKPSVVSVLASNIYDEKPNVKAEDSHRFIALVPEVDATVRYMVRVFVP